MRQREGATHVVVDTDVASWLLNPRPLPQAEQARRVTAGRTRVVSFMTVTELHFGVLSAGWGELRRRRLERSVADLDVIQTGEKLIHQCAQLRAWARRNGHAIGGKIHEADRWVAATALLLGLELVAGDGIFNGIEGLDVSRIRP